MPRLLRCLPALCLAGLLTLLPIRATNPLILDQFTADPTARVFAGRVYLYPSHDIPAPPGRGRPGWFCMEDYHAFSSENLTDWTDHGVIVRQTGVPWVDATTYSLWAPDCVAKDGRYYFFFPALAKAGGFRIGVATADHPAGPFAPEPQPIAGVAGIDPCVLLDRDGRAYLFFSSKKIFVAPLSADLRHLAAPPQMIDHLPATGLLEGPFVFMRHGRYYLTYPHVEHTIERLEYAIGEHPLGPYRPAGVILDESADGCWTVHHSIVEYQGEWYLFYHDKDLSPDFDKHRSVRADALYFNADGTIRKVVPTLRGVGAVTATSLLQIDRYSAKRADATVAALDPARRQDGWSVALPRAGSWVRFDRVDFGRGGLKVVTVRARGAPGGRLELRLDRADGPAIAQVEIDSAATQGWALLHTAVHAAPTGLHDLIVTQSGTARVEVDWVRFAE